MAVAAEFRRLAPAWSVSCDVELPAGRVKEPARYSALARADRLGNDRASIGRPPMTFQGWKVFRGIVESDLARWNLEARAPGAPARNGYICWTINDGLELRQLVAMGVHGILTDRPRLLRRVAARKGRPLSSAARDGGRRTLPGAIATEAA